ncbi:MAG: TRAP transporter fused permease subunit [Pseudolabrys sp.]
MSESQTTASAMTDAAKPYRPPLAIDVIYYVAAIGFSLYMFNYYWTTTGGPVVLAMTMVPICYILFLLQALRNNDLYPELPVWANYTIVSVFSAFSLYCAYYMNTEYRAIGEERAGFPSREDIIVGGIMVLLILEYSRKRHMPLLILNIILLAYAVYGYFIPGMFYHAGLSWNRVIAASSTEMATGIFSNLPQLALTLVGVFLLVLSLLRGFGCIDSLLRVTKRVAVRSHHAIPQSAVVGSMAIGTVSGSGAANSITVGSATIPAMINAGIPGATAAAIESAASMGGQLMPPVMGIAAFLMAEFLGVDYFDVVARGWVPGLIYYITVAVSVYLLAIHHRARMVVDRRPQRLGWRDKVNLGAFVLTVGGLIALMAVWFRPPQFAALEVFCIVAVIMVPIHIVGTYLDGWSWRAFIGPFQRTLDAYIDMISDITLLLATLSIMTGALVITGVTTKLGFLMVEAAGVSLVAMVLMGFIFGAVLGTGLPPAPVYILVAIVLAPPFMQAGINPWVVHFFAFFVAVFGELTPPTSITAAITAKIANASFYSTLWRAVQICMSLFTLMAGVFIHPAVVIEPGLAQLGAGYMILVATVGMTFSVQAKFFDAIWPDRVVRAALAAMSLFVLLTAGTAAVVVSFVILGAIGYWYTVCRRQQERDVEVIEVESSGNETRAASAPLGQMN